MENLADINDKKRSRSSSLDRLKKKLGTNGGKENNPEDVVEIEDVKEDDSKVRRDGQFYLDVNPIIFFKHKYDMNERSNCAIFRTPGLAPTDVYRRRLMYKPRC